MQINPQGKRFVPVNEYQRISGLSYKTVMHMIQTGQLPHITTESAHKRVDTQANAPSNDAMQHRIEELHRLVKALCKQFNVQAQGVSI